MKIDTSAFLFEIQKMQHPLKNLKKFHRWTKALKKLLKSVHVNFVANIFCYCGSIIDFLKNSYFNCKDTKAIIIFNLVISLVL